MIIRNMLIKTDSGSSGTDIKSVPVTYNSPAVSAAEAARTITLLIFPCNN